MFCSYCGNKVPDNAKFCNKCGASLVSAPVDAPVYKAPEQPAYSAPQQPSYSAPVQPAYSSPAVQNSLTAGSIAMAICAIVAFAMLLLPWVDLGWGLTLSYFELMDASGEAGYFFDEADTMNVIMICCLIVFGILELFTIIKGFMNSGKGAGIGAGVFGMLMVLALMIYTEFEMDIFGVGVYLFFAMSLALLIIAAAKKNG